MLFFSWRLSLVALAGTLLYLVLRISRYIPLRGATEQQIIATAKQQSHFLESVRGVKTLKLFQGEARRQSQWLNLLVDQFNAGIRVQRAQIFYGMVNGLLNGIEKIVIVWWGAQLVIDGSFTAGALIAFLSYRDQTDTKLTSLINSYFEMRMLRLQLSRVADIMVTRVEARGRWRSPDASRQPARIELRNIRVRYGRNGPLVLDNVSLVLEPRSSLAIVGPSGCGKTTLMNVMLGLVEPVSGQVLVDGVPITASGTVGLRRRIATVTQDDVLFAGSIRENISFFDQHPDDDLIRNVAAIAQVSRNIDLMPMGYRTLVGDMGSTLSGGQKQRILLARALYKRPDILLMDEATSHLDQERETLIVNAIQAMNITRVSIAHRRETILSCENIIKLDRGRIMARGRTADLMRQV